MGFIPQNQEEFVNIMREMIETHRREVSMKAQKQGIQGVVGGIQGVQNIQGVGGIQGQVINQQQQQPQQQPGPGMIQQQQQQQQHGPGMIQQQQHHQIGSGNEMQSPILQQQMQGGPGGGGSGNIRHQLQQQLQQRQMNINMQSMQPGVMQQQPQQPGMNTINPNMHLRHLLTPSNPQVGQPRNRMPQQQQFRMQAPNIRMKQNDHME